MPPESRLREYRTFLIASLPRREEKEEEGLSPEAIRQAVVSALREFTNDRGELRTDTPGVIPSVG